MSFGHKRLWKNLISIGKYFLYFAPQNPKTDPKQHVCLKGKGQFFVGSVLDTSSLTRSLQVFWFYCGHRVQGRLKDQSQQVGQKTGQRDRKMSQFESAERDTN